MTAETDVAWLAGLLEGEGCFHVKRRKREGTRDMALVKLAMTDRDVVERAAAIADGGSKIRSYTYSPHKEVFVKEWNGRNAIAVMELVLPYMGVRRTQKINETLSNCNLSHVR